MTPDAETRAPDAWFPPDIRRPWLRLLGGLVAAPVLLTALAAAIAFAVGGLALPDAAAVRNWTLQVTLTAAGALIVFGISFAPGALLALRSGRRRSALAFAAAGALAGLGFAGATSLALGAPLSPAAAVALTTFGALHLVIVRAVAGLRRPRDPAQ